MSTANLKYYVDFCQQIHVVTFSMDFLKSKGVLTYIILLIWTYVVWFFMNLVLTSRHSKNPIFGIKLARLFVSAGNKNEISTFLWTNIHFILISFPNLSNFWWLIPNSAVHINKIELQVILFEIDCAIFYTNLHELFGQFISWTNWVNSGKFMDNC